MDMKLTKKICFLIYDNRSGSTYLSALLDTFDEIGVTLESPFLFNLLTGKKNYKSEIDVERTVKNIYTDKQFQGWKVPVDYLNRQIVAKPPKKNTDLIYLILESYFSLYKPNASCWLYKCGNPYLIKRLKINFPDAKYIFIYRDGRSVFCSKKKAISLTSNRPMEEDPIIAAKIWKKYLKIIRENENKIDIHKVKYEELITDPTQEISKIFAFLMGFMPSEDKINFNMGSYYNKIPSSQLKLHPNVAKKPLISRIDGWKREIEVNEAYFYEKTAAPILKLWGYEIYYLPDPNLKINKIEMLSYRSKLIVRRLKVQFRKVFYYAFHPIHAWKKIITKLETNLS